MITASVSIALGLAFVLVGGVNVWLVLEAWSRVKATTASSRMLAMHRIGGYVFIALFCVMSYFMMARLRNGGADTSPGVAIHLALAMLLSPLLFIKVLIARYYRNHHNLLMPIGLAIFVLAFVLIASTAGPHLARTSRIEQVSVDPAHAAPVPVDLNQAGDLMEKRCSKCHNLDRVVGARKDAQGWLSTVNRMQAMTASGISAADVQQIVAYLTTQNRPQGAEAAARQQVERALVDQRCGRCHSLDRVYQSVHSPDEWRETVNRMVDYAAGSGGALQAGEDQKIIEYLSATQSPEAATQRRAQADAASSAGRSLIADKPDANVPRPTPASQYNHKTLGFISFVCLAAVTLAVRRPGQRKPERAQPITPSKPAVTTPRPAATPFVLQLVQITAQTADAKTLRFAVRGERKLDALPGQFLTFAFLFDGRKETRCYSICSSTARSGYVEITPKRVNGGCVSVYLNDHAGVGMTVEATGPFGAFCLDPVEDRNVVLIAAGSGITPMMGMLRYLDDLCLDTQATLLYCVRTANDIMFRRELDDLQRNLKNFRYEVLLSKPDPDWAGARGHVHRGWIQAAVPDVKSRTFFLCGPPPFMSAARTILQELGVEAGRIRQETFGGAGAELQSRPASSGLVVEFARSGKTCAIGEGQTLLQVAMENGVEIPSACRQGQCGTCKTRLLSGEVRMSAEQGLDPESKSRGFVLTCVGHAAGDVKLDA
ncbi:MAG TPA: photosystem P840 reaction-center cytochrome c-551 [Bryobacteraceae bacterium]|nr:photosystem P840 reaction-center cytochrome c-551 [Bryobacteraceae bacterium]